MRRDKAVKADVNQRAVPGPEPGRMVIPYAGQNRHRARARGVKMDGRYPAGVSCTRWCPLRGYCAAMPANTLACDVMARARSPGRGETRKRNEVICERCNKGRALQGGGTGWGRGGIICGCKKRLIAMAGVDGVMRRMPHRGCGRARGGGRAHDLARMRTACWRLNLRRGMRFRSE